ncbi:MAG: hypothetical protein KF784_12515 [Fimbriimonadaceae bacterium]|nr:hypothetical protein [Fimbriimonadaceae bacterium]
MQKSNALVLWIIAGVLVFGCCGVAAIFGGGAYIMANRGGKVMQEAQAEGDTILRKVAQPWSAQAIFDMLDESVKGRYTLETIQPIVEELNSEYGSAVSFSGSTMAYRFKSTTEEGTYTEVAYSAGVVFQKKVAHMNMILRKRGDKWSIYDLRVLDSTGSSETSL